MPGIACGYDPCVKPEGLGAEAGGYWEGVGAEVGGYEEGLDTGAVAALGAEG